MADESTYFNYQPPKEKSIPDKPLLKSVFSTQNSRGKQKLFMVQEIGPNRFEIQEINNKNIPSGPRMNIDRRALTANYTLEIDIWEEKVRPVLEERDSSVNRGENHRNQGELYSAEMEYQQALHVDEDNVRATFSLGQIYIEQNNTEKARDVFRKILNLKSAFMPEHKHMFNDFGIAMRKNGMYKEAIEYYERAVKLDSTDENILFNIARTYFESGDWENCIKHLTSCLQKNKGVEEAKKFCIFIVEKSETDSEMLAEFGSTEIGKKLRSDILSLLREMQIAAGINLDDAIESTQRIRDKMLDIEERRMQEEKIAKENYKLDGQS